MSTTPIGLNKGNNSSLLIAKPTLQEAVQQLVDKYRNLPLERQAIIDASIDLTNQIVDFHKDGSFDKNLYIFLDDLCCLLHLPSMEVENYVIQFVCHIIKEPAHFVAFVKNGWLTSLINLEMQVSRLLHQRLRENHSVDLLFILDTYEYLLEQLFLFSLLSENGEKRLHAQRHLQVADSSSMSWRILLEKEGMNNEPLGKKAAEIRSSFQSILTQDRTAIFEDCLKKIKENLDKELKLGPYIGECCAEIGHWDHSSSYYDSFIASLKTSSEKVLRIKIYLLKRLVAICLSHSSFGDAATLLLKVHNLDSNAWADIPADTLATVLHIGSLPLSALSVLYQNRQHSNTATNISSRIDSLLTSSSIYFDLGSLSTLQDQIKSTVELLIHDILSSNEVDYTQYMKVFRNAFLINYALGNMESAKEAKKQYEWALSKIKGSKDGELEQSDLMEACLHLAEGRYDKAIELFEKLYSFSENPEKTTDDFLVFNLNRAYWLNGEHKKAIAILEKTIPQLKDQGEDTLLARAYLSLGLLHSYLQDNVKAKEMFSLCLDRYKRPQADLAPNKELSITFFEERAAAFLGMESVLIAEGEFEKALIYCDQKKADVLVTKIAERLPNNMSGILSPEQWTFEQMQAVAREQNTVFVSYTFAKNLTSAAFPEQLTNRLYVFIIKPEGNLEYKELNITDLPEEVKSSESLFETFPYTKKPLEEGKKPPHIECDERYVCLYKVLLEPIENMLPPREANLSLTFIPEGTLAHISFAALKDKTGTYLIEKYPVAYAPSIRTLYLLSQMHPQFPDKALVVYNPTTPNSDDNLLQRTKKEVMEGVMPCFDLKSIISRSEEGAKVTCIMDEMPKARWIHLACHGVANNKRKKDSVFDGLFKLAEDEQNQEGFLRAETIGSLKLNTELVFLSACHSGRGNVMKEGTLGPNWSFLAAGALSTVSTHWALPVNDVSNEMIKTFYSHLFGSNGEQKLDAARALQKATLDALVKNRKFLHQWAVFFLTGINIGSSSYKNT